MSHEDRIRCVLGGVTCLVVLYVVFVQDGRLPDDTQFLTVTLTLMFVALLVADDCRLARSSCLVVSRNSLEALHLLQGFHALEHFEDHVNYLQALPWKVYHAIAPSLERLTGAVRGDGGSHEQKTTDLIPGLYMEKIDAGTLHADGKLDTSMFEQMKLDYKRIVSLLCHMKSIAPEEYDTLVTAIGGCTPQDMKAQAAELLVETRLQNEYDDQHALSAGIPASGDSNGSGGSGGSGASGDDAGSADDGLSAGSAGTASTVGTVSTVGTASAVGTARLAQADQQSIGQ